MSGPLDRLQARAGGLEDLLEGFVAGGSRCPPDSSPIIKQSANSFLMTGQRASW